MGTLKKYLAGDKMNCLSITVLSCEAAEFAMLIGAWKDGLLRDVMILRIQLLFMHHNETVILFSMIINMLQKH